MDMQMVDAAYKTFLPSKNGNWFGYSDENPYVPPARKSKTVAACLDYNYWLRHRDAGATSDIGSWFFTWFDWAYLVAFDPYSARPDEEAWKNLWAYIIGLGKTHRYEDW